MLSLEIPSTGDADLVRNGGNLVNDDDGLEAAITISLFSDRRADPDDDVPGTTRRGWWGDALLGGRIGSHLWKLRRENDLQTTLDLAQKYATDALQWLVDDGVAAAVTVVASRVRAGILGLFVTVLRPGSSSAPFARLWEARTNAV